MSKVGKKHRTAKEKVAQSKVASWKDAIDLALSAAHAKFDESLDVAVVLGIDPSKGEQTVRGSVLLPNGTGKKVRVLVFAKGEHADKAKAAGADHVGFEDLIEKIESGWLEFDVAVATPDLMGKIGTVAKILGPKGLLPNNKQGTVTFDVESIVKDLKKGRVSYRNDKGGAVNATFGKVSFGREKLIENLTALIKSIIASKPASAKGNFIRKMVVSSTMGAGIQINPEATA